MNEHKKIMELMAKLKDTREEYNQRSRSVYMVTMKPGDTAPAEGRIYGDEYLERYRSECAKIQKELHDVISGAAEALRDKSTAPPSADAVNAITLFGMRESVTAADVDAMMKRYGDNPLCYASINEVAKKSKIYHYEDDPVAVQLQRIDELSSAVDQMMHGQIFDTNNSIIDNGVLWVLETFSVEPAFPSDGAAGE